MLFSKQWPRPLHGLLQMATTIPIGVTLRGILIGMIRVGQKLTGFLGNRLQTMLLQQISNRPRVHSKMLHTQVMSVLFFRVERRGLLGDFIPGLFTVILRRSGRHD